MICKILIQTWLTAIKIKRPRNKILDMENRATVSVAEIILHIMPCLAMKVETGYI